MRVIQERLQNPLRRHLIQGDFLPSAANADFGQILAGRGGTQALVDQHRFQCETTFQAPRERIETDVANLLRSLADKRLLEL